MKKTPHALTRLFTLLLASLTILSISVAAAGRRRAPRPIRS